jgi:hypothetical protein
MKSILQRPLFALLAVLSVMTALSGGAWGTVLYDVDFGSPPHTVGQAPVTNTDLPPRDGPSSINFGNPTVVSEFGLLTDQPLEFNSFDGTGDQVQFTISSPFDPNLPPLVSSYNIEADLVIEAVENLFNPISILIDTPEVRTISFRSDGTVTCFVPFLGCGTDAFGTIGTFTFGALIHLRIELSGNTWQISLNDALVHSGPFNPTGGGAFAVRVSVPSPPGRAGLDNVMICSVSSPGEDCEEVSDTDEDNDTIADACDNCQFIANTDQTNTDADQLGDACDPAPFEDVDGVCPCGGPLTGDPANACSGPLFSGPWNNHGEYIACVSRAAGVLLAGGKITASQQDAIVGAAGASSCGGKK